MEISFAEYIKTELLILIPVLCLLGKFLKSAAVINDKFIPIILGMCGIILSVIWVASTTQVIGTKEILPCVFTSITQGILVAGAAVYTHQIKKQINQ